MLRVIDNTKGFRAPQMIESIYHWLVRRNQNQFTATTSNGFSLRFDLTNARDRRSIYEFIYLANAQMRTGLYNGSLSNSQLEQMIQRIKEYK